MSEKPWLVYDEGIGEIVSTWEHECDAESHRAEIGADGDGGADNLIVMHEVEFYVE